MQRGLRRNHDTARAFLDYLIRRRSLESVETLQRPGCASCCDGNVRKKNDMTHMMYEGIWRGFDVLFSLSDSPKHAVPWKKHTT